MITPTQCRMARAALGLSTQELADAAGVGVNTVNRFEAGQDARVNTVAAIRAALERQVVFIPENGDGPGVRLRKQQGEVRMITLEERARSIAEADAVAEHAARREEAERHDIVRKLGDEVLDYCAKHVGVMPHMLFPEIGKVTISHSGHRADLIVKGRDRYEFSVYDELGPSRRVAYNRQGMLDALITFLNRMRSAAGVPR